MNRDLRVYLDDIAEAIEAIEEYAGDVSHEEFSRTRLVQDAIIRRIEVIGEAARSLPQEFRNHPAVPWSDIVAMRNRVIHEYFGVMMDRVWEVVRRDIPVLKAHIEQIRRDLER